MSQSLSKVYLHIIFHIKTTSPTIAKEHIPRLHAYIGQLVKTTGCNVICVGGIADHVHALVQLTNTETVAHLLEAMKRNSSRWIKTLSHEYDKFAWQGGYAVFSISQSLVDRTTEYIRRQEEHHEKKSFRDEYLEFLKLYSIEYDERYVLSD